VLPVKLLSKTNDTSKLLSSKPHHTFTEKSPLEMGYSCLKWISMEPRTQIS